MVLLGSEKNYMVDYCSYDSYEAESFGKLDREYLNEVFPHKYDETNFSLGLISDVSGTFYTNVYEPIQHVPFEYERWCKKEDEFEMLTFVTIGLCMGTLVVILLLRYITPLCIMNFLTLLNIALLASCLYKFSKLESLARRVFR